MKLSDLKIDPDFEKCITPLAEDEFNQLRSNILKFNQVFHPIMTWNGYIIDGHNRCKILEEHPEVSWTTQEMQFDTKEEVISFICDNQLGRRNLTPEQKKYLIGKRYAAEKTVRGASDGFRGNQHTQVVNGNGDRLPEKESVAERIAKETGISEKSVRRAEAFAKGLDIAEESVPGIRNDILTKQIRPKHSAVEAISKVPYHSRGNLATQLITLPKKESESAVKSQPTIVSVINAEVEERMRLLAQILHKEESPSRKHMDDTEAKYAFWEMSDALGLLVRRWNDCVCNYSDYADSEAALKNTRKLVDTARMYLDDLEEKLQLN